MHPWFVKEGFSPQAPSQLAKEVSATDITSYLWDPAPVLGLCQDFPRDLDEAVTQDSTELPKKGRNLNERGFKGESNVCAIGYLCKLYSLNCSPAFSSSKIQ